MMKHYLLSAACLALLTSASGQTTWDNFENIRKGTYGFISGSFIPYNENPDQSGANTSLVAASYTRNPAELFDVIILDAAMANLEPYVDGLQSISIDVWSPAAGIPIQITLENSTTALPANYPTGRHSVYLTETTMAQQWETLTFTFSEQPDPSVPHTDVNRLVLLFNPNTNTSDQYFWDNLVAPELQNDPCAGIATDPQVLNDFECQQNVNFIFSHSGVNFRRIVNPDMTTNTSQMVAQYIRNGGEETDVIIGRFNEPLLITAQSTITLDVWDAASPTTVLLSLQAANGDVIIEMVQETSVSGQWQTLTFDPSPAAASTDIEQFVLLFDPGNFTSDTYYFDNFEVSGLVTVPELPAFEGVSLFPNPAREKLQVRFGVDGPARTQFHLYDVNGKLVFQSQMVAAAGLQQFELDISALSAGAYAYALFSDQQRSTGKLLLTQ